MRRLTSPLLGAITVAALTLASRPAAAGPWTLNRGRLAVDVGFDVFQASTEWLPNGRYVPFSLRGETVGGAVGIGLRYGVIDRLELSVQTAYKIVSYTADPVILSPPADPTVPGALQRSVVEVSGRAHGLGDVYLGGTYNFLRRVIRLSGEVVLKIPTGYKSPRGNFDVTPDQITDPLRALEGFGGRVKQDITLGDGQADLMMLLQMGASIPRSRTFFRVEGGMNFRFNGPGHQAIAAGRVGQGIGSLLTLFVGTRAAITVNRGQPIGTTVTAIDPLLPADRYGGLTNLDLQTLTRDRSYVFVEGGLILRVLPSVELRATYSRVVWGENYSALNVVSIGTTLLVL